MIGWYGPYSSEVDIESCSVGGCRWGSLPTWITGDSEYFGFASLNVSDTGAITRKFVFGA